MGQGFLDIQYGIIVLDGELHYTDPGSSRVIKAGQFMK